MKWAIWVPWEDMFRPAPDGDGVHLFDTEAEARAFCGEGRTCECIHGHMPPDCEDCWWQAKEYTATAEVLGRPSETL